MPSYITHATLGKIVHNKSQTDNKLYKTDIKEEDILTFSLGHDLSSLSNNMNYLTHNTNTKLFFYNLISYIKTNKLYDNPNIMAYLYGHITHYYLDTLIHPYINQLTKGELEHLLLELNFDDYIKKEILNTNNTSKYIFNGNISKELKDCINENYYKVYNKTNIYLSYILMIKLYKEFESKKTIIKVLYNNKNIYDINYMMYLFNESLHYSLECMLKTNEIIYDNKSFNNLDKLIKDISYDTGLKKKK